MVRRPAVKRGWAGGWGPNRKRQTNNTWDEKQSQESKSGIGWTVKKRQAGATSRGKGTGFNDEGLGAIRAECSILFATIEQGFNTAWHTR